MNLVQLLQTLLVALGLFALALIAAGSGALQLARRHAAAHLSARRRGGFTLIELILALAIMSMVAAAVYPRMQLGLASSGLGSANRYVRTYLVTARSTAIQRSRTTKFVLHNDTLTVRADTLGNGSFATVLGPLSLSSSFSVTASTTQDSIVFSMRGFARNISGNGVKIILTRGGLRDSVCASKLGFAEKAC